LPIINNTFSKTKSPYKNNKKITPLVPAPIINFDIEVPSVDNKPEN
jgi:hypothetical protein